MPISTFQFEFDNNLESVRDLNLERMERIMAH